MDTLLTAILLALAAYIVWSVDEKSYRHARTRAWYARAINHQPHPKGWKWEA